MKTVMSSTRQKKVVLNNDLKLFSIIVWLLYRGSISLYDYSLGLRVQSPLYILNNVVELVY